MDLPPDKAKVLNSYDDDKKWDIICDQVCVLCSLIVHDSNFLQLYYRYYWWVYYRQHCVQRKATVT